MKFFQTLILISAAIWLVSCGSNEHIPLSLVESFEADLSGAVGIAAAGFNKSNKDTTKALSSYSQLSKIVTNGSVNDVLKTELQIESDIDKILIGDNGSVFCLFATPVFLVDSDGNNTDSWIQLICITPEEEVLSVWPQNPLDITLTGSLEYEDHFFDFYNGDLYFYSKGESSIYCYGSTNSDLSKVFDLMENTDVILKSFAVNSSNEIFFNYYTFTQNKVGFAYKTGITSFNTIVEIDNTTLIAPQFGKIVPVSGLFYIAINAAENSGVYQLSITDSLNYTFERPLARFLSEKGGYVDSLINPYNSAWYPESALLIGDASTVYSWNENLLSNGSITSEKLYWHMRSYFSSGFSIKAGALDYMNNTANFTSIVTQLEQSEGQTAFCDTWFNGALNEISSDKGSEICNSINTIYSLTNLVDGIYGIGGIGYFTFNIFKLFDINGNNDYKYIPWDDQTIYDTTALQQYISVNKTKIVGDNVYFSYQTHENVNSSHSANYDFGRVNLLTGATEYFEQYIGKEIEVSDFTVSGDNSKFIFTGEEISTGNIFSGIIDLTTWDLQQLDSDIAFNQLESF